MDYPRLTCVGRCDGMGDVDPRGSYVRIVYTEADGTQHGIRVSEGAAELLAAELTGALAQKDDAAVGDIIRNVRGA